MIADVVDITFVIEARSKISLVLVSLFLYKGLVLFPLMVLYLSWSIIQWMLDHDRLSDESHLRSNQSSDSK